VRVKLLSGLKSTFAGRPFHTITTRSLKNVDLTRAEQQLSLYNFKECPLVLVQVAHWKKSVTSALRHEQFAIRIETKISNGGLRLDSR